MTRTPSRARTWAMGASVALAAGALSAVPASGAIGEAGIRPGKNITVFHNIDFVAVFGYGPLGRRITVRVVRDGVTIGSASGRAAFTPEGAGLEVNHGLEGIPQPGDCWSVHTPDIRPGDHILVSDGAGTDEVIVDDLGFTGDPFEETPGGDVLVPFTARRTDGTAIPLASIDSPEFRATSKLRFEATDILIEPALGGGPGEYVMRYTAPFTPSRNSNNLTQGQIRARLLDDGHAVGFGHVAPLPPEAQLVEGLRDASGPAPGCEASPPAAHGVSEVTPGVINAGSPPDATLRVRGFSQDATGVEVTLADADTSVVGDAIISGDSFQTWAATFTPEQLVDLTGRIRVSAAFTTTGGGVETGPTQSFIRDTVAPDAPTATPAGTYRRAVRIALRGDADTQIRYTLGNGRQAAPTAGTGTVYRGRITLRTTRTLKMVAVDAAGNVSPVARARYRLITAPSRPRIRRASAGAPGGRSTAVARWSPPARTNGARITGYRVTALELEPTGAVAGRKRSQVLSPRARAHQMRLPSGRYRFQVRAINAIGASPWSAASNQVRPR